MKVLICSSNTGEGHNYCSKALQQALSARGIESDIIDTLELAGHRISHIAAKAYLFSSKSNLFRRVYTLGGLVDKLLQGKGTKSPVYVVNSVYAKHLYNLIVYNHYDAVVCPHLYPSETLTYLRRNDNFMIPAFYVATDYTCIPFVSETELDGYIIPHRDLTAEYVENNMPADKLFPLGIPVIESRFTQRTPQLEARKRVNEIFNTRSTHTDGRWFLMMSGSMGHGNLEGLVNELIAWCQAHDRVICVCGRNKKTLRALKKHFSREQRVMPIGFTNEVPLLMDAADVLLTKPGGITSTEACIKNIPIVHTEPIPGLENHNVDFFVAHGMSCTADTVSEQADLAFRLCADEQMREHMLQAQRNNTNPHAADDVVSLIVDAIQRHAH